MAYTRPVSFVDNSLSTPINAAALHALQDGVYNQAVLYSTLYTDAAAGQVNVKSQGAVMDGVTDDRAALNGAITAMSNFGGGTVYLPPGRLLIGSGQVQMRSNVSLVGAGIDLSFIVCGPNIPTGPWWVNSGYGTTGLKNVLMTGFTIDGNYGTSAKVPGVVIEFRGGASDHCKNVKVRGVKFINASGIAIAFREADDGDMLGNYIDGGNRDGLHLGANCSRWRIMGNSVQNCGDDGIAVHAGQTAGDKGEDNVVVGNTVKGTTQQGCGITLSGQTRGIVANNTVVGGHEAGISIWNEQSTPTRGTVIVGNSVDGAGADSVLYVPIQVQNLSGYDFYSNPQSAIVEDTVIANNVIRNSIAGSIKLTGWSGNAPIRHTRIIGNIIVGSGGSGSNIGVEVVNGNIERLHIDSNSFVDLRGRPLTFTNGTPSDITVSNNYFYNCCQLNAGPAISLGALNRGRVFNNIVVDTQTTKTMTVGLNWGTATGVFATGNDFSGTTTGFTGTQPATCKKHANFLPGSVFEHGDTA